MSSDPKPVLAFVWRQRHIVSSVVDVARRTKTRAIFDISSAEPISAGMALLQADAGNDAVDLKVAPELLKDAGLEELLKETGLQTVWVELHPLLLDGTADSLLQRMVQLSSRFTVIPIVADVNLLTRIVKDYPEIEKIALKGNEAAGFVGSETIFTLYGSVREHIQAEGRAPQLFVWGGVAVPEAVAALISAGSAGVVFESLHWLTDLADPGPELRDRVANLRPDHMDLVGSNLGVPCRLFNKGNSKAVKELKSFAGSLCGSEIRDEQRRFFVNRIRSEAVEPLDAQFGREELIPVGIEASFAGSFARRFGARTEDAVESFAAAVESCCEKSAAKVTAFSESPAGKAMGTQYPFVQGAMSWITDEPEFARAVADAGGLPTIALGLMDKKVLDERLGRLADIMGKRPYAVNVITLAENPHRDIQLAWIKEKKPRFAVIAAGEPSHGAQLIAEGIDVIYIAPNEELLRMAFDSGIRYVICEGNEGGGHVGQHSTFTLAQMVLELRERDPQLFEGRTVILAGGVFNRETAFMAAMLGADAVQMGTAYLATAEIVRTGALSALYQKMIVNAAVGSTTITGEGTGLRVRSLRTPMIEAVCDLERDFAAGGQDEGNFRRHIEAVSAGSLFVAARCLDRPGGEPLDEEQCVAKGQFMSGACAGAIAGVRTVAELHRQLAEGSLAPGLPVTGPIRERPRPRPKAGSKGESVPAFGRKAPPIKDESVLRPERIAITGMSQVNSLGNSPEEVWAASLAMRSGIVEVPPSKWDHSIFYHPRPRMSEKTYCKVAAFQDIAIDRKELGIPPQDFRTMTSATKVTMWLANRAIEESGILNSDIPRERIAVLISQNSGEAAATLQDVIIRGSTSSIISAVKSVVAMTPETEHAVDEALKDGRIIIDDTTLLGRLNCSAGGFICNKYGFQGPSFSVSAACATALVALYSAVQMIRNGIIDAAVVGGAEEYLTPMHFLEFSALGALAGLSGLERPPAETSRPFDDGRDGMVLGEGGGMIVIERESVARKRGARAHAYITTMGASNNNLGMVESSQITQEIAIRASFKDIPYGPDGVDLIECHATSTRQGDGEEVKALKAFFNGDNRTVLTSFKSQIGHTLGASGVNSLIRGVMGMKSGIFPPTLNYVDPDPEIRLEESGFIVHPEPADWHSGNGRPRRLQVNAFGFGGSNYVVQIEQALEAEETIMVDIPGKDPSMEKSDDLAPLPDGVFFFTTDLNGTSYRVAVVADSEKDARAAIESQEPIGNGGQVNPKRLKALSRQGIHLGARSSATPPVAFVFPGQGSHYAGMGQELYNNFPIIKEWMDRAAKVADFDLLHLLFHDREEDLQKTRWQQPALFTIEYAMVQYLLSLGIRPAALAGHSLGELTALCLSGVYSFEDGFRIVNRRAVCMDKACTMNLDPGVMMACDAPMEVIEEMMPHWENVYVTNINSPRQIVMGGNTEEIKAFGAELKKQGYRNTLLRVSMAFHSPIMTCIHDELEEFIAGIEFHPPRIPVISNTTMKPFPEDTTEIKRIVMAHLESPVHWKQNVRTLWDDYGVRLFVEVGPREILSNLILDTIEEAECVQTCLPSAEVTMCKTAVARLLAAGCLHVQNSPKFVAFPGGVKSAAVPEQLPVRSVAARPQRGGSPLEQTVEREINAFVLDSFGRFLKPAILAAIRRDHDPNFTEAGLESLLVNMYPSAGSPNPVIYQAPVQPLAVPSGTKAPLQQLAAVPAPVVEAAPPAKGGDVTESVIGIIMDATGYERNEIEPEMDLREDLSIRSSRLPVIMDALEAHFGIKIDLEDFMDVRTIKDISDRISLVMERSGKGEKAEVAKPLTKDPETVPTIESSGAQEELKRVVFHEIPLEVGAPQPVEVSPFDRVAIFSAGSGTGLRREIGTVFRRDYGAEIVPGTFLEDPLDEGEIGFDARKGDVSGMTERIAERLQSPAGLVFVVDDMLEERLSSMEGAASLLKGFFSLLKMFVDSPAKKFVLLVRKTSDDNGLGRILAEGALGMFLSAGLEFGSVQFRTAVLDAETDLRVALRGALDRSRKPVETIYREGKVFTSEGKAVAAVFRDSAALELTSEDVVVFSGGGYGITSFLAGSLAPYGCRMVLLGRTVLDPEIDFRSLLAVESELEKTVEKMVYDAQPELSPSALAREKARIIGGLEIVRTMEELRDAGIEVSYFPCDVTDTKATLQVAGEIIKKYGKITGIVHGAGILRDSFIKQMKAEDFAAVVDVKFLGMWNLFQAVRNPGLHFAVCLSSAAAIQGNPGQTNYAAGNRMMSALLSHLSQENESVRFKSMMLPPIEGTGMAEDPEIRALMARLKAGYVHLEELGSLFCAELFLAPREDVWVLFMRSLPDLETVRLNTSETPPSNGEIRVKALSCRRGDFPMIDRVERLDIPQGALQATRTFSLERDKWIADHKPFKFLKHPIVSGIMALETFMEASRIMFPHLRVRGIQDARFLDIIECPVGTDRAAEISCRKVGGNGREVICELSLATQEISPSGRVMDRMQDNYRARVMLGGLEEVSLPELPNFPVGTDELETRPMDNEEVIRQYSDESDMQGRYRVMSRLDGTGQGAVRGHIVYRESEDFSDLSRAVYQYSPYLLEALLQVVNFYAVMRNPSAKRSMIPTGIGEMLFARKCRDGEPMVVEGRIRAEDTSGVTWDARAVDGEGKVIMVARNIVFRSFE